MAQWLKQSTLTRVTIGPMVDATDAVTPETGLSAGTVDEIGVYKHEATSLTDISGDTTFTHRSGGIYTATLDTGDTDTLGRLTLFIRDDDVCRPLTKEFTVVPSDTYEELMTTGIADAVWDEVLTSATHNVGYSAGQRVRYLILTGASAQAGGDDTITLAASESSTDNIFTNNIMSLVGGTGAGQTRVISEYDGDTNIATVDQNWDTNPDGTTIYQVLPFAGVIVSNHGVATGGAASTITLAGTASAIDDTYNGSVVYIAAGTGAGQARVITDYVGGTNVATVGKAWTTQPVAGSVYKVLPVGRTIVDSISDDAADEVWAASTRTLTQSAASVASAVSGAGITLMRGDTMSVSITGLGNLSARSKLWFTVKGSKAQGDLDSIIQIEESAGLLYLNGTDASARSSNGSITIDDATSGDITIELDAAETDDLASPTSHYYDIQMLDTDDDISTLSSGTFKVTEDITRAIT